MIRTALVFVCMTVLLGCAETHSVLRYNIDAQPKQITWPDPPGIPRYRYVGQLVGEQNFVNPGSSKTAMGGKVVRWLAGLAGGKRIPVILQRPQTGFVDQQGSIYVTDVSRQAVLVFDRLAGRLRVWEMAAKNKRFRTPVGIAAGPHGEIWVADAELKQVVRLDSAGKPLGSFGQGQLRRPTGLAVDAGGSRVFVADTHGHDIKVFDFEGHLITTWGHRGTGPGEFNAPTFISYAHDHLYVTDTFNSRVQIFDAGGEIQKVFGRRGLFIGELPRPKGIAVDSDSNIYVVESYYDYLLVYDAEGRLLLPIGGTGQGIGQFYLPAGVWTDKDRHIFVADMFNGRVVVLRYLGAQEQAVLKPAP